MPSQDTRTADERAPRRPRPDAAPAARPNIVGWALTLIALLCAIAAFALIIRNELRRAPAITIATAPAAPRPAPVEVQVQPVTINPDAPAAPRPVAAQPAPAAPAAPVVQVAPQFSPIDLGDVPVPTVQTTLLSPEQLAAAQASEEQTFLNNANAGLTPAQRAVAEYNACVAAGGCGVVR